MATEEARDTPRRSKAPALYSDSVHKLPDVWGVGSPKVKPPGGLGEVGHREVKSSFLHFSWTN